MNNRNSLDLFAPTWVLAASLLLGTTIRTIVLLTDPEVGAKGFQVLGPFTPEEALPIGLVAVNLGVISWLIGYHLPFRFKLPSASRKLNRSRYKYIHGAIVLASLLLMALYLDQINFFSSLSTFGLSAKRMFVVGGIEGSTTTFTYFRMASDFLATLTIIYYAYTFVYQKKIRKRLINVFLLFLLACLLPFVASARGEILYLAFSLVLVRHYFKSKVTLKQLSLFIVIAFICLGYLNVLRQQAYQRINNSESYSSFEVFGDTFHTMAYNAHFLGVGKTAVVVKQVPEKKGYLWGSSYLATLIAPIPRVLWPQKPVVRVGRMVGVELFERASVSGVPPGLIGEAYLNFGWFGILTIPFLFGVFCKTAYRKLILERRPEDFFAVALYAISWVFILDVFVTDFTGNIMRVLRYLLPFLLIYFTCYLRVPPIVGTVRKPAQP